MIINPTKNENPKKKQVVRKKTISSDLKMMNITE